MKSRMEWDRVKQKWVKTCTVCLRTYEADGNKWVDGQGGLRKFFSPNDNKHDGLQGRCKECQSHITRDRVPGRSRDEMIKEQGNKCFLCLEVFPENNYYICMDHDIKTRQMRKLICKRCNIRMAGVDDDEWLTKAIEYRDYFRQEHRVIKLGHGKLQ